MTAMTQHAIFRRAARTAARGLFTAAALIGLAACGSDATGPAASASLELRNDSNLPIVSVNIAACSDESWGGNRLSAGESVAPGAIRTFQLTPGCWDVRASTSLRQGVWWDQEVNAGGTIRLALPEAAGLSVVPDVARAGR
jgi:hypothetical protein